MEWQGGAGESLSGTTIALLVQSFDSSLNGREREKISIALAAHSLDDRDEEKDIYGNVIGLIGEDWLRLNFN